MSTENVESTETTGVDTKLWIHPRTGQVRHYIDDWRAIVGLDVSYYKTGNVSYATYKGERVSNSKASEFTGKAWVDEDGKVHLDGFRWSRLANRTQVLAELQAAVDECWYRAEV